MQDAQQQERRTIRKMIIIVAALLAAAALFGVLAYRMASSDDDAGLHTLSGSECEHVDDENLCRFFATWETTGQYAIEATSTQNSQTTEYVLENDAAGNFRLTATGEDAYELVAVDTNVYTRNNGAWSQQTVDRSELAAYRMDNALNFAEPASEAAAAAYSAAGTEACGERTCLTYHVALEGENTMQIWFDDEEHRLRRVTVTGDNYTYEAAVNYRTIDEVVAPPEPVALPDGQYIPPGSTEPQPRPERGSTNDAPASGNPHPGPPGGNLPASGDRIDPEEYRQWLKQRNAN